MLDIIGEIKRAKLRGVPFIAINTADQLNLQSRIAAGFTNPKKNPKDDKELATGVPVITWDIISGITASNDPARDAVVIMLNTLIKSGTPADDIPSKEELAKLFRDIILTLLRSTSIPIKKTGGKSEPGPILILMNAHRYLDEDTNVQAIMNLRAIYESSGRTLIFLGPSFAFPSELASDIHILDEALPTKEEIKVNLIKVCDAADIKLDEKELDKYTLALKGLGPFSLKQASALALRKHPSTNKAYIEIEDLWEKKRRMISQIPGLVMEKWGPTFDDIGGLVSAKEFMTDLFNGPNPPVVLVFLDELEKMLAGSSTEHGDSSGTSQDAVKVFLTEIEDRKYRGQITAGPPGTCKSFLPKCVASTFRVPLVTLDLGAAKGGIVGSSERMIRDVMRTLFAIAGEGGAYFMATCNRLTVITPEMKRRFKFGIWMADLPDEDERVSIGKLQTAAYGIKDKVTPEFWRGLEGWSGANIRDMCELARDLGTSLEKAKTRVVPALTSDYTGITALRRLASGKFLSCSKPGVYTMPDEVKTSEKEGTRQIGDLQD